MKTTDPQERDKPDGAEAQEWTWFIENPPDRQPAQERAPEPKIGGYEGVVTRADTRPNARLQPLSNFWMAQPTIAFVIVYLLMVLGIGCILEVELRPSDESLSSERRSPPVELVPVAVQSGIHSSPMEAR